MPHNAKQAEQILRDVALAYPGTHEDFPWGERVVKVNKKVFVFMGIASDGLKLSLKLPKSNVSALDKPFAQPTGYGLGKSGWVTVTFDARDTIPLDLLRAWLDESYRAVAPKKLVAALSVSSEPRQVSAAGRTAAARKPRGTRKAR